MLNTKNVLLGLLAILIVGTILLVSALRTNIEQKHIHTPIAAQETQTGPLAPETQAQAPTDTLPVADISLSEQAQAPTKMLPVADISLSEQEEDLADPSLPVLDNKYVSLKINANGSSLRTVTTTHSSAMCEIVEPAGTYIHPVCSLYFYQDNSRSADLFDQSILRERIDFKDENNTPLQKIIIHKNGKTIHKQIVYLPDNKRKELTFSTDGKLVAVDLYNDQTHTHQHILYSTTNHFEFPISLAMENGPQQIVYQLNKEKLYDKTSYKNNQMVKAFLPISWKQNEKGQAVLEDGQMFPPRDFWGVAPKYCQLYPHDCITH